jgi:alkylhydroperoxidase family enzyme
MVIEAAGPPVDASITVEVLLAASGRFGGKIAARAQDTLSSPDVQEVAMLEGITRIPPVDVETLPDDLRETLEEQRKLRGAPLYPYLFYARNPAFFRAAKEMWTALQQGTKRVPGTLRALLNRRVAWWNGCEF